MGDPKFPHKKYSTPRHPWEKVRIDEEKVLLSKYGLKNKRELWEEMALLKSFRSQARTLQAKLRTNDPNALKQFQLMIRRLNRYGLLPENATLDDVLSLTIDNILSRRLQSVVFQRNFSISTKQARQMVTHGHILLNGRRVTIPSMLVERSAEESISYSPDSPFVDEIHPVRKVISGARTEPEEEKEQEEVEPAEPSEEGEAK